MSTKLPTERIILQLDHASVVYTCEHSAATGRVMPKLEVQAHDQYGFQREFSVGLTHQYIPATGKTDVFWEYHIYQHPGRRHIDKISEGVARRFIVRFLELCQNYPALLFNKAGDHVTHKDRPRHEGFVRLAEMLHREYEFTVKLLD